MALAGRGDGEGGCPEWADAGVAGCWTIVGGCELTATSCHLTASVRRAVEPVPAVDPVVVMTTVQGWPAVSVYWPSEFHPRGVAGVGGVVLVDEYVGARRRG